MLYPSPIIDHARNLRKEGRTYSEIRSILNRNIPKSTLSHWFKEVSLPSKYYKTVGELNLLNLSKARIAAVKANSLKRQMLLNKMKRANVPLARMISSKKIAKIALAMLCLGEASKSKRKTSFYLGNSDPQTITIFIELLKLCFEFKMQKTRATVQCRADQDIRALKKFWMQITDIPEKQFYKTQIDPRTVGKPTLNKDYKGVLRIDYLDSKVRLELESLIDLIYYQVKNKGR